MLEGVVIRNNFESLDLVSSCGNKRFKTMHEVCVESLNDLIMIGSVPKGDQ